jgi:hypothetical protein
MPFLLISCAPRVVEHTLVVTQVPEKVTPPTDPVYEKIPDSIHIGSKQAATIIWKNFIEAERARKEALAAFEAYDAQVNELNKKK